MERRRATSQRLHGLYRPQSFCWCRFLPQKAAELRVPRGPLYARLKGGETVTASDGRTVEPYEVREFRVLMHPKQWRPAQHCCSWGIAANCYIRCIMRALGTACTPGVRRTRKECTLVSTK